MRLVDSGSFGCGGSKLVCDDIVDFGELKSGVIVDTSPESRFLDSHESLFLLDSDESRDLMLSRLLDASVSEGLLTVFCFLSVILHSSSWLVLLLHALAELTSFFGLSNTEACSDS